MTRRNTDEVLDLLTGWAVVACLLILVVLLWR